MEILTEDLTVRELVEVFGTLSRYSGERALLVDYGVRQYLLSLLRERLPKRKVSA